MARDLDVFRRDEQRQFNRKLLLFFHTIAALAMAVLYLGDVDLSRFQHWRRGAGVASILFAAPPLAPYIISAVHSWRTATYSRTRVAVFLAVLVAGTLGAMCVIVGGFGLSVDFTGLLWTFAIQTAVYFFAAEFLFVVD